MKNYKKIKVTEQVVESITCDLCHKSYKPESANSETEIHISITESEFHYDYGYGRKTEIDLCPDCFKNKLIPFLKQNGAECKEEEFDW